MANKYYILATRKESHKTKLYPLVCCFIDDFCELTHYFNFYFQFEPTTGPTRGGTSVTITGSNFGARRQDIVSVMIDGVLCNVTGYTPGIS